MATELWNIKRLYSATLAALSLMAKQWGYAADTKQIVVMESDGVTKRYFSDSTGITALFTAAITGTTGSYSKFTGANTVGDGLLTESGGALIFPYAQNGSTVLSLQNTTAGTGSLAGLNLASDGTLSASLYLASSSLTNTVIASRLHIASGTGATGINIATGNATDTVKTYFGTPAAGTLFHTLSNKGITLGNIALTTDADGTAAGVNHSFTLTKNDSNTRQFYGYKMLATLNAGGSNANTTVDLLSLDTTNTAVTGVTANLINLKYGGASKFKVTSSGALSAVSGAFSSLTDTYFPYQNSSGVLVNSLMKWRAAKNQMGLAVVPDSMLCVGLDDDLSAAVTLVESTATPATPTVSAAVRFYMKADKFVLQYDDAGTARYKYLDLTGTGVTWVHTTSAP